MSSGLGLVLVLKLILVAVLGVGIGIGIAGAGTSEEQALKELEISFCASHHGSNFSQGGIDSRELGPERRLVGCVSGGELVVEGLELRRLLGELRGDRSKDSSLVFCV